MERRQFLRSCIQAGAGLAIWGWLPPQAQAALRIGDTPPKAILHDLNGNSVSLPADFKGKVVLIHFWASWCSSCKAEMADLEFLYNGYGKQGVIPCSIDVGETKQKAENYIRSLSVTYPVLLDPTSSVARLYGVTGIPTTYILGRDGIIRYRILGEINRSGLEKIVRTVV